MPSATAWAMASDWPFTNGPGCLSTPQMSRGEYGFHRGAGGLHRGLGRSQNRGHGCHPERQGSAVDQSQQEPLPNGGGLMTRLSAQVPDRVLSPSPILSRRGRGTCSVSTKRCSTPQVRLARTAWSGSVHASRASFASPVPPAGARRGGSCRHDGAAECCRESEGVPQSLLLSLPPRLGARGLIAGA